MNPDRNTVVRVQRRTIPAVVRRLTVQQHARDDGWFVLDLDTGELLENGVDYEGAMAVAQQTADEEPWRPYLIDIVHRSQQGGE